MNKKQHEKQTFDIHRTLPPKQNLKKTRRAATVPGHTIPVADNVTSRRRFGFKRFLASLVVVVFLFVLIIAVWDAVSLSRASSKMFGNGNLFSLLGGDLKGSDGRTNILLAGYSADDAGHNGATLTDSIMLISLDKKSRTGYMLSIPRDLYVNIPGFGYGKINEAYQDGERSGFSQDGYAPGGMGLLESIVSDKLGVPIDYYALLDYAAFRDTVDAVGGITITIASDDPRGIYDPSLDYTSLTCCALANYPNGTVTLNGKQALNLARARGDAYGSYGFGQADFDRTLHQRQMLVAMRQKAVSWRVILDPRRSGHLFDGLANNVRTDLDTGNVLPLFSLFHSIDANNLKSYSLRDLNGKNYLTGYGGALIPLGGINNYSQIDAAIQALQ